MAASIRLASERDAAAIHAIYAPIVRATSISFEFVPPTPAEIAERVRTVLDFAPWIVWDEDGTVAGYAYAGRFRPRAAYQWTAEVTVYVAPAHHRRGIGRALYAALFDLLRVQGFHTALAGITLPNPSSVALHEKMGFVQLGVLREVGHKQGRWHDTGWWQLVLGPGSAPLEPRTPSACAGDPAWRAVLEPRGS